MKRQREAKEQNAPVASEVTVSTPSRYLSPIIHQPDANEVELADARAAVRLEPLGADRQHRTYWAFRSVAGRVCNDGERLISAQPITRH